MPRWRESVSLAAAAILAVGCPFAPEPEEPPVEDTSGLTEDTGDPDDTSVPDDTGDTGEPCLDADGDGHPDAACGGGDCDDADPEVHPDAEERLGSGEDRDCDGVAGMRVEVVSVPAGLQVGAWRWSEDNRAVGGSGLDPSGDLVTATLRFPDLFGPLSGAEVHARGEVSSLLAARRLWEGTTPVDVVATSDGSEEALLAWQEEASVLDARWTTRGVTDMDARLLPDALQVVTCGGGSIQVLRAVPATGTLESEHAVAHDARACVLLALGDQALVLGVGSGGLYKWTVEETGLVDRVRLADDLDPDLLAAASRGEDAFFAFSEGSGLVVLHVDGTGLALGAREAVPLDALAIDADGEGGVAVAWAGDDGDVMLAVGTFPDDVETRVLPLGRPARQLAVGLRSDEVVLAAWDGEELVLARALR